MKKAITILILLAGVITTGILSCKKLPRDNPLDIHYEGSETAAGILLQFSKSQVVYDNNNDGIINPNETIYLKVYIKNSGTSIASDVKASISTGSSFISSLEPSAPVKYNSGVGSSDIYPGGEEYGDHGYAPDYSDYTVKFKVAQNTPAGTDIAFNMNITDEAGNEWEDTFTMQVSATGAILNYSKHSVVYDNNHDGIISQNETAYLKVYIKNNGTSIANDVHAVISTSSSYISNVVPTTQVSYNSGVGSNNIYPGDEDYGDYGYTPDYSDYTVKFKVAQNTPAGTEITFNMLITDEDGNEWDDTFTIQISATGAILNYSKHTVAYDDNLDGIINPNETAYLKVYIKNNGTSIANDVHAIISTSSSYISDIVPATQVSYNSGVGSSNIYPGDEDYGDYGYTPNYADYTVKFKVAENTPAGTDITFNMHITDEEGNEWEDSFMVSVQ